jgi:hypothetical protein
MISYSWLMTILILIGFMIWLLFFHYEILVFPPRKIARDTKTIADPGIVSLKTSNFYRDLTPMNRELRATNSPKYRFPTSSETSQLNPSFLQAYQYLSWKTPYLKGQEPQWIIAEKDTEAGMPHTLENYVILPEDCWSSMSSRDIVNLFVHEICHIHQRQHPREWNEIYVSKGFQPYPSWVILPNQRMNPDTIEHGMWSYKGVIPVEIFKRDAMTIRDTELVWKPVSTQALEDFVSGKSSSTEGEKEDDEDDEDDEDEGFTVTPLRNDFPFISQLEHPNEIYACMIAEYFIPNSSNRLHPHMKDIFTKLFGYYLE